MELPDFDTSEFIQTLFKSEDKEEVLYKLPIEKKIDFFAKNYLDFLQAQNKILSFMVFKLEEFIWQVQFRSSSNCASLQTSSKQSLMSNVSMLNNLTLGQPKYWQKTRKRMQLTSAQSNSKIVSPRCRESPELIQKYLNERRRT